MRKTLARLLAGAMLLAGFMSGPSLAQDANAFVIVPDHPGGVGVYGCYRANQPLYGPYILTFCLERRGTYQIRGGGVRCDGRLNWWTSGRDVMVDIQRASCGGGVAWEAASMDCRPTGRSLNPLGQLARLAALRCTYHPTVRFKGRRVFTANRI
ncbi:MAG: hypothetical protein HY371_07350 [Devosia nanyangense]|nr:hypothetical protein [Devosia nanyangense]